MGLAQLEQIEKQMFQAVLDGQMPAEKITLPNIYNLTSKKMYTPCYDETRRLNKAFNISWPEEKCRFREEIAACNASANCRKQNMADPGRWWKKQDKCRNDRAKAYEQQVSKPTQECLKNVNEQYKQYVDRRAQNINKVYKMLEEKYTKMLEEAKGIAGPAINWTQSYEVEFKELLELTENKELMYSSGIDLTRLQAPPDLPGSMGFGGSNVTAQAYDSTKIKNVISSMNKALAMIKGINFDKLNTPIEKADFSIEEIGGFFNENPWLKIYDSNGRPVAVPVVYKTAKPSEAAEKLMFGTGPGTSTGIGAAASLVTLSDPKEVATEEERKTFFKALMQRNPNIYQEYLDKLLAIPLVTNRNYYKTLTNFSPDKAYSLYKEALADYNNTVNQANEVNKRFAEAEQVYRQASSVGEICSFYDNNFKRWQLMRKTSPSAAAKLLNQDSDRFEETVNQYEKKMELARSQIVLPDVGSIRREIDRFNDYAKAYRVSFEKYYAYLAEYFKDKEYPLFDMPDVSQQKMRANNIQIFSDEYSSNFKKAADGLKEMKAAATEFKNTDKTYIIAISQANSQKAKLVNDFIAFYKSNPDKIDTCLKKLEETRKAVLDIAIPADYQYDHQMPKSVRDTALRQRYDDSLSKLIPIE
ncbi:MAG: hypothetical protein KJ880_08675, partial [Candidatus Omnitrophica bacterium]|nr:hypothetical protein [Candidatus Omnitrophota bacterium]